MKDLIARFLRSHAWRAWQLRQRRGPVLAGGIAYAGLFSVFGAVVAGFAVFGLVLGSNGALFDAVVSAVDDTLPGLLDVPAGDGVIEPSSLVDPNLVSWARCDRLRHRGVRRPRLAGRAARGRPVDARDGPLQQNVVKTKLVDVGVLATLGLAILASAVVSIGTGSAGSYLLRLIGLEGGPIATVTLRLGAVVVVAAADAVSCSWCSGCWPACTCPGSGCVRR